MAITPRINSSSTTRVARGKPVCSAGGTSRPQNRQTTADG